MRPTPKNEEMKVSRLILPEDAHKAEVHYLQLEGTYYELELGYTNMHKAMAMGKNAADVKFCLSNVDEWVITDLDYILKGNPHN